MSAEGDIRPDLLNELAEVVRALKPLDSDSRRKVIGAALALLGEELPVTPAAGKTEDPGPGTRSPTPFPQLKATDVRALKVEKQPKTDIEMAVLVAYYLAEMDADKQDFITAQDLSKYFKQADHPLPKVLKQTLLNAKNAGYLDSIGPGQFKLNPVGYNLIAHGLPREGASATKAAKGKSGKIQRTRLRKPTRVSRKQK